jgi:hypothetical protein
MGISNLESAVTTEAPLPTYKAQTEHPQYIKERHKSHGTSGFTPVGVILEKGGIIAFSYGCLEHHPHHIPEYQKRGIVVLNYYPMISFEAFLEAEKVYKRRRDLEEVDKYLALSLQQRVCGKLVRLPESK